LTPCPAARLLEEALRLLREAMEESSDAELHTQAEKSVTRIEKLKEERGKE
jgi:hypothetical protein